MDPCKKMYCHLFNAITSTLTYIEINPTLAKMLLIDAQQTAEELFIN